MNRPPSTVPAALLLVTGLLPGCTAEEQKGEPTDAPTYHRDVAPILRAHCQGCHAPGAIAPFALTSHAEAAMFASELVASTAARTMPPWGAEQTDECAPRFGWQHDRRLSDDELATLAAWHAAGDPEGDPADAPDDEAPAISDKLADPSLTVAPAEPLMVGGDDDQFVCFVIDPQLAEDTYVDGFNVLPGAPEVVHHVGIYVDRNNESAALADADGRYPCYGSAGFYTAQVLGTWVPGGGPTEYPPEVGFFLPKGAKIVMQVHYHPAGAAAVADLTRLELRFAETVPDYRVIFLAFGNAPMQEPDGFGLQPGPNDEDGAEFRIPAGVAGHTETIRRKIPEEFMGEYLTGGVKLYSVTPHMHYVGTDIKIDVERTTPAADEPAQECVIQTPRWDFDWQKNYAIDAPIADLPTLRTGDIMTVRCTYDNTTANAQVMQALRQQGLEEPGDVHLGESSLDEMCVGLFSALVEN